MSYIIILWKVSKLSRVTDDVVLFGDFQRDIVEDARVYKNKTMVCSEFVHSLDILHVFRGPWSYGASVNPFLSFRTS